LDIAITAISLAVLSRCPATYNMLIPAIVFGLEGLEGRDEANLTRLQDPQPLFGQVAQQYMAALCSFNVGSDGNVSGSSSIMKSCRLKLTVLFLLLDTALELP
jgi:hypothetical protein